MRFPLVENGLVVRYGSGRPRGVIASSRSREALRLAILRVASKPDRVALARIDKFCLVVDEVELTLDELEFAGFAVVFGSGIDPALLNRDSLRVRFLDSGTVAVFRVDGRGLRMIREGEWRHCVRFPIAQGAGLPRMVTRARASLET